jgi:hypothetical protein
MTPDFPSAARAILSLYEFGTGEGLDGVIVADPFAVKELFRVTGPAEIPSLGTRVSARTVVDFLSNEAYVLFDRPADRKTLLGDVVGVAFGEFLSDRGQRVRKVDAIAHAVAGGHLKIYPTDPTLRRGLELARLDRGLRAPDGSDLLAVHVNSRSGSKVDFYAERSIRYDVLLGGEGEAQDDAMAMHWFRKAAAQGHAKARKNLRDMEEKGRLAASKAPLNDAAKAPATDPGGDYRIQLGSMKSEADAEKEAARLRRLHKDALGDLTIARVRADLGERGVYYRLRAGPLKDAAAATALCHEFASRNQGCIVIAPAKAP